MWNKVRALWPETVATLLLLAVLANAVRTVKANESGRFVYTIDDGFFHMSVARNLLHHGLWGISPLDGFSSGTSSLLWPLMLTAVFAVFGIHEYFPLVLNVLAAIGLVFYAGYLVRRVTGSVVLSFLILVAIVIFTPMLAVASTGMEHCLQCLLCVIFVDRAARLLTSDEPQRLATRTAAETWLCVTGLLMVMTRYEGLFLIAPVGLLLLCQRRWRLAVTLGICAAAPITIFGLIAVSKGWYFLPNSLLLKGHTQLTPDMAGVFRYFRRWYEAMLDQKHMLPIVAAVIAALLGSLQRRRTLWTYPGVFLFVTLAGLLQHLQFAQLGWFYRYEAYLLVLSFVGVGVALGYDPVETGAGYWWSTRALPQYAVLTAAALVFGTPLWARAFESMRHVVTASYNIYEQQYQMGHFVGRYYKNRGVAANDIGALSYFGESDILDLVGLSDADVLRAKRAGAFNQDTVRRLLKKHHVELVVVYDTWAYTYGGILPEWVQVGRWTIPNNTIVASETISFYAPSEEFVPVIKRQLQEFRASLPGDVTQDGAYLETFPVKATGTYPGEVDAAGRVAYWTGAAAQFAVYPGANAPLNSDETTLKVAVQPGGQGQTIEVFFNSQLVETKQFSPGEASRWTPLTIKVKWHNGANDLKFVGHGPTAMLPDGRSVLFMVLDPRQTMDEAGNVTPTHVPMP